MKAYSIVTGLHPIKSKTVLLRMSQLTNNTPIKGQRLSYFIKRKPEVFVVFKSKQNKKKERKKIERLRIICPEHSKHKEASTSVVISCKLVLRKEILLWKAYDKLN